MRYFMFIFLEALVLINLTGCKKHDCTNGMIEGQYAGTFRNMPSGKTPGVISHITLSLSSGTFNDPAYGPLCPVSHPCGVNYAIFYRGRNVLLTSAISNIASKILSIKRIN